MPRTVIVPRGKHVDDLRTYTSDGAFIIAWTRLIARMVLTRGEARALRDALNTYLGDTSPE